MATLVIVESPAKARKIAGLLGAGFVVRASLGHVRDLPGSKMEIPERYRAEPWAHLGVNPETFAPIYVVPASKRSTVKELRQLAGAADRILFASDMDREGEAISYHLSRLLNVEQPTRMVFTEITREALQAALQSTRPLDLNLVAAQEARRVIDRLVGYEVSPLLWSSVGGKLSAGRVQSAALMLLAQREMARMRFRPATFWSVRADVLTRPKFTATVTHVRSSEHPQGLPIARAGDYTPGGVLKPGTQVLEMTGEQVRALSAYLDGREATVTAVDVTETRTRPAPPFITSTLQQAGGRLNLSAKGVMDAAQRLYEGGLITYMRTDSPALSDEALTEARREATRLFGPAAVPAQPRQYATRNPNAQEAHEAIRPAGTSWRAPAATGLSGADLDVYTLIYQRTVASQMLDAVFDKTVVTLTCGAATLGAQGRVLKEAGFLHLLQEDDGETDDQRLPALQAGQRVPLKARAPEGKKTSAPTRFTEATLVQAMEKAGIGRPSTYAQTLSTLQTRAYVRLTGRHLAVTAVGLLVTTYLARQVPDVMQNDFTATMEAGLDDVAAGTSTRVAYLTRFWTQGLAPTIRRASREAPSLPLPHLNGTRLRATAGGAQLVREGQSAPLPDEVIPADLDEAQADAVLQGTWTAKKSRAGRAARAEATPPGTVSSRPARKSTRSSAKPRRS
ncbi:type I DNA topoisomerase [Deinococcus sedimenti]|nr:type I DNA topoisomerase [Deinococcus sedimenti]